MLIFSISNVEKITFKKGKGQQHHQQQKNPKQTKNKGNAVPKQVLLMCVNKAEYIRTNLAEHAICTH